MPNSNTPFTGFRHLSKEQLQEVPPTQPRYTVELTIEGWQIKDNATDQIKADVYSDKLSANVACEAFEEIEAKIAAAEGESRR